MAQRPTRSASRRARPHPCTKQCPHRGAHMCQRTRFGGVAPLTAAIAFSAAISAIFVRVSTVAEPMCGRHDVRHADELRDLRLAFEHVGAAPRIAPERSAATSAFSSITRSARSVDDERAGLHPASSARRVVAGRRAQRNVQREHVAVREQRVLSTKVAPSSSSTPARPGGWRCRSVHAEAATAPGDRA